MPRKSVPSYRLHKASGQARSIVNGKHIYLGKYNSPESRQRYARLLAEMSQAGEPDDLRPTADAGKHGSLLVCEVLVKYLEFAEDYYAQDGDTGKEFVAIHRNRKTKVYPCELRTREKRRQKARARKSKWVPGTHYCPDSYRRAITYGINKANAERKKADPEAELIPSWTPYRLRHTFATRMRKAHGVEAAQLGLGHARTNIVDVYAEKNLTLIVDLARTNG